MHLVSCVCVTHSIGVLAQLFGGVQVEHLGFGAVQRAGLLIDVDRSVYIDVGSGLQGGI